MPDLKTLCENATLDFVGRGVCKGVPVKIFYPDKEDNDGLGIPELAQELCRVCPVRLECLAWALAHERYGFWGGHTEKQRRKIRKQIGLSLSTPKVEPPIDHGTERGYMQHLRREVLPACDKCKRAHAKNHYDRHPEQSREWRAKKREAS